MIYSRCQYPGSCDCSDCEEKTYKKALRTLLRKPLNKNSRLLNIKEYYKDIRTEYTEDNMPTNIFTLFEEILSIVPVQDLEYCNTLGLFQDALQERTGKKKEYI